jgi:hypothetical protein
VSELIRTRCRCPSSSSSTRAPPVSESTRAVGVRTHPHVLTVSELILVHARAAGGRAQPARNADGEFLVQELHDEEDPLHRACPNFRCVPAAVSSTGWGKWHSLTDTARRNGRVACSSRCVACCCASCWRLKAWSVEKRWGPLVLCTTTRRSPGYSLTNLFGVVPT